MDNLDQLVASALAEFAAVAEPARLEDVKACYLGKDGTLTALLKGLGKLPPEERKTAGAAINVAKGTVESALAGLDAPLVYPFFMAEGYFTGQVLPERIAKTAPAARLLPPFGSDPALAGLAIRCALEGASTRMPGTFASSARS